MPGFPIEFEIFIIIRMNSGESGPKGFFCHTPIRDRRQHKEFDLTPHYE